MVDVRVTLTCTLSYLRCSVGPNFLVLIFFFKFFFVERLLNDDEEILTAEMNVEKFVYKKNYHNEGPRVRFLFISRHRSALVVYEG